MNTIKFSPVRDNTVNDLKMTIGGPRILLVE